MQNSDEQSLIKRASNDDQTAGNAALWMLLLLRLTTVTSDSRLELRNSKSKLYHSIEYYIKPYRCHSDSLPHFRCIR